MMRRILLILILIGGFGLPWGLKAQEPERSPHLVIQLVSGETQEVQLSGNPVFEVSTDGLNLLIPNGQPLNIANIKSMGIKYYAEASDAVYTSDRGWTIFRLDGTPVCSGTEGCPDFSNLKPNEIYLVRTGNKVYKFVSLK